MATYTKVSRSIPSQERVALITNVAAGDRIDLEDVLGRPARKVIFQMTDAADVVEYKLNHLRRLRASRTPEESLSTVDQVFGQFGKARVDFWSRGDTFSGTGSSMLETAEGLSISSLEIMSLTLADPSGAIISISVT